MGGLQQSVNKCHKPKDDANVEVDRSIGIRERETNPLPPGGLGPSTEKVLSLPSFDGFIEVIRFISTDYNLNKLFPGQIPRGFQSVG